MGFRTPQILAQVAVAALVLSVDLLAEPAVTTEAARFVNMEVEEVFLLQITSESAADTIEAHCSPDLWTTTVWRLLRCPCATPESSVSEVCARRTTLWTVAALALVFLQSSVKDVVLLSL
mmetsp:Transcript_33306/g.62429  ORF Transcript_33306/g.62429 Transcript_33306/m.62429 type:complete len:120 (+) Transcript_33306:171-530(+)